ncbi:uncharacterized protein LOC141606748 [Silene latifolia]|uniref:uncharacterized protein LOC141606748 n=1 Tax=Silene latifolia TaxID=37657 RepID=UPI003D770067
MDHTRGHTTTAYGEDDTHDHNLGLQHTGGGHEEGEHKSVLKKVKAKAKKIKDTITGHGHGHDDDDDDDDDEMDTDPNVHGASGKEGITGQQRTNTGAAIGGHDVSACNPGAYQVFDPTTTHYVPGQEETLGWSRTDTGTRLGPGNQPGILGHTPVIGHSSGIHTTGDLGVSHKPKLGGIIEKDSHVLKHGVIGVDVNPGNYQAQVGDPIGREGGTARQHGGNLGERATMEGASHIPMSKPLEYQTFDTSASRYVPGQEETLGWSRTDTGRSKLSEEQPYAPKNTPVMAHTGHHHNEVLGTGETRESGKLSEVLDRTPNLERDPHAPRDVGERRHAENYQSKVIDPTGRGGEELGVTPIIHQLGKMNIHDDSTRTSDSDVKTGQAAAAKGVSVKEYLAEKLKPSEEDKALSKVITEALPLHKKQENPLEVGQGEKKEKVVVKGRVTESEEVANRLGRSEETDYDGVGPGLATPGKTVMDRFMDAAGSWFNRSGDPRAEADDHTRDGDERTQRSSVGESQQKQNVGEPGLQ